MSGRQPRFDGDRAGELWLVLLLLIVVVVPTISVLWFVSVAMRNEQLASKQRLSDAYRAHLENARSQLDDHWLGIARQVDERLQQFPPHQVFAAVLRNRTADAVVLYDESRRLLYPAPPLMADSFEHDSVQWSVALRMEHRSRNVAAAAQLYGQIFRQSADSSERARAMQAQARCLLKAGAPGQAFQRIAEAFRSPELAAARDAQGRHIGLYTELLAVEHYQSLSTGNAGASFGSGQLPTAAAAVEEIVSRLVKRIQTYDSSAILSSQRLFVMKRLRELLPARFEFPLLAGEELAAEFVAAHPQVPTATTLRPTNLRDVLQLATPSGRAVLLFATARVRSVSRELLASSTLPSEVQLSIAAPNEAANQFELLSIAAGRHLPGWRLSLAPTTSRNRATAAADQTMLYFWTGCLVIASTCTLGACIARAFRRELRLASLKTDLVGTVTHELKTPLASIRLLVDTLLDAEKLDEPRTVEYLRLIAKENTRLSRLIDNFLTFSRMEQGKHHFRFFTVSVPNLLDRAVEAAGDRFQSERCQLNTAVAESLPMIRGDEDALITALLNLLENAYKYATDDRHISLTAEAFNGSVHISVKDNGMGLSKAAAKRVFERFFQVDQTLAREGQGCGLGLSIVQHIVQAHGGTARVESQLGHGSTFIISLPASPPETQNGSS